MPTPPEIYILVAFGAMVVIAAIAIALYFAERTETERLERQVVELLSGETK